LGLGLDLHGIYRLGFGVRFTRDIQFRVRVRFTRDIQFRVRVRIPPVRFGPGIVIHRFRFRFRL